MLPGTMLLVWVVSTFNVVFVINECVTLAHGVKLRRKVISRGDGACCSTGTEVDSSNAGSQTTTVMKHSLGGPPVEKSNGDSGDGAEDQEDVLDGETAGDSDGDWVSDVSVVEPNYPPLDDATSKPEENSHEKKGWPKALFSIAGKREEPQPSRNANPEIDVKVKSGEKSDSPQHQQRVWHPINNLRAAMHSLFEILLMLDNFTDIMFLLGPILLCIGITISTYWALTSCLFICADDTPFEILKRQRIVERQEGQWCPRIPEYNAEEGVSSPSSNKSCSFSYNLLNPVLWLLQLRLWFCCTLCRTCRWVHHQVHCGFLFLYFLWTKIITCGYGETCCESVGNYCSEWKKWLLEHLDKREVLTCLMLFTFITNWLLAVFSVILESCLTTPHYAGLMILWFSFQWYGLPWGAYLVSPINQGISGGLAAWFIVTFGKKLQLVPTHPPKPGSRQEKFMKFTQKFGCCCLFLLKVPPVVPVLAVAPVGMLSDLSTIEIVSALCAGNCISSMFSTFCLRSGFPSLIKGAKPGIVLEYFMGGNYEKALILERQRVNGLPDDDATRKSLDSALKEVENMKNTADGIRQHGHRAKKAAVSIVSPLGTHIKESLAEMCKYSDKKEHVMEAEKEWHDAINKLIYVERDENGQVIHRPGDQNSTIQQDVTPKLDCESRTLRVVASIISGCSSAVALAFCESHEGHDGNHRIQLLRTYLRDLVDLDKPLR